MADEDLATTDDAVLGGRLRLIQPRRGHRVGHDAILLAAATGGSAGEHAVDLGAGVGAAGLALAARVPGLRVTLVEIDPALAALAAENIARNGVAERMRACALDVAVTARSFAAAGLPAGSAARVLMNPPFNDPARQRPSPDRSRRLAHESIGIAAWITTAARLLGRRGVLTMIWRPEGLPSLLADLSRPFGAVTVMPVHPRPQAAAIRILVRAVKASRAPPAIIAGLILADDDGRPTAQADAILRNGAALPLANL
jgi:tRNA1(Val) A37 N6-methylase TrmN6